MEHNSFKQQKWGLKLGHRNAQSLDDTQNCFHFTLYLSCGSSTDVIAGVYHITRLYYNCIIVYILQVNSSIFLCSLWYVSHLSILIAYGILYIARSVVCFMQNMLASAAITIFVGFVYEGMYWNRTFRRVTLWGLFSCFYY